MASGSKTVVSVVAASCAIVLGACGTTEGTAVSAPVEPSSSAAVASTTAPPIVPAPNSIDSAESNGAGDATSDAPAQPVPCVDPDSPMVADAVASLGLDQWGGTFAIDDHTPGTSDEGCPEFEWARATATGSGHVTVTSHILFFHNSGRYLGTATSDAYSYTSVIGASDTAVQVLYRWLDSDDAFCCPSNESVVDFEWDGTSVTPYGEFPPPQG